jgi:hypothetical protein
MAINPQAFHPQAPAFARSRPDAYYAWLTSNGFPYQEAYNQTTSIFGPPKTPEQQQKEQAAAAQRAGFGQAAGAIGGAIAAQQLGSLITGGSTAAATGAGAAGTAGAAGAAGAGAGAAGAGVGTAGAGAAGAGAAGGTAATAGSMPAMGTTAVYAAPIIGAALAGYNYNRWSKKGKTYGAGEGFREAAKDPLNYLIPAGFIGAAFGDKDMYLKEHRRLLELKKQGVNVPEGLLEATRLNKGRSKEELINIEKEKISQGGYGNVKFAESRNEADLNPEDIIGYSAFMKKFGSDWFDKFSQQQRLGIAKKALEAGAVNEAKGSINIDWNKLGDSEQLASLNYEGTPGAASKQLAAIVRPKTGEVGRQSAGLYRDDKGKLVKATSMREALGKAYNKSKEKEKK